MKTHQLERITGAVKNTFGCVFGLNKSASHAKFATAEVFAKMIADLNNLVVPKLHIMDGIMAMEGNGPQSGTPTPMNLILASTDPVALDAVFCHLVYLKPQLVPTNATGMEQGVGTYKDIEVITPNGSITPEKAAEKYGNKNYNVQRSAEFRGALQPIKFLAPFLEKKPIVHEDQCIGCGICVKACPVDSKAIKVDEKDKVARYDYSKCIKCYCCQEMCPEEAIKVKKSLLARLVDRNWKV
jgi:NAD-dependent dihydropyrimidine dehydrogenase PreA subunit